jgi:capsular polysaccharide biosynthesis protein
MDKVQYIKNARVTNNSVILKNYFSPIEATICIGEVAAIERYKRPGYLAFKYIFPSFPFASRKKNYALITTEWSPNIYHWFFETLPKLVEIQKQVKDFDIILPEKYLKIDFIMKSLKAFGFDIKNIITIKKKSNLKVRNLYYQTLGTFDDKMLKSNLSKIREKILNFYSDKGPDFGEKIYISREKSKYRKIINEDELVKLLAKKGYKKILMEDYSFLDQLSIIRKAKYIIGCHGAGLGNALFAKERVKLYEFNSKKGNACYEYGFTNNIDHVSHKKILCELDGDNTHIANMKVDLKKLEKIL